MKKAATITTVLLILAGIIGLERMKNGLSLLSPNGQEKGGASSSDKEREISDAKFGNSDESEQSGRSFVHGANFSKFNEEEVDTDNRSDLVRRSQDRLRNTCKMCPFYFIRFSSVVNSKDPSEEEIFRLKMAVALTAKEIHPDAVIFNIDNITISETPVLLYARDECDLTDQVKKVYGRLEGEPLPFSKAAHLETYDTELEPNS